MRFSFMCKREKPEERIGKKVAIIGSGPAGLAATGYLACKGYYVTVYERLPYPGGLMVFGIPGFRIPKHRVLLGTKELEEVFGVEFKTSSKVIAGDAVQLIGDKYVKRKVPLENIIEEHDAILIATGTWIPRLPPAEGLDKKGVYTALEYLFYKRASELELKGIPRIELGKRVGVVGAGLVAVDAALEAIMDGHKVYLLSIEKPEEAPAGSYEIIKLIRKGARHIQRVIVKRVLGDGKVKAAELVNVHVKFEGFRIVELKPIEGTERVVELDSLIFAIGQKPTPPMKKEVLGIKLTRWGGIEVDDYNRTTRDKVFAAGDVAIGPSKVGRAVKSGLRAAYWIDRYLTNTL